MWIVGDIAVGDKRVLPNISISIIAESPTNDNQSRLNERLKKWMHEYLQDDMHTYCCAAIRRETR
jgi:hypothetical protein